MKGTNMYSNISCEKMVVDAAKVPSSSKDLFVVESTSIKRFDMDNANGIKTGLESAFYDKSRSMRAANLPDMTK